MKQGSTATLKEGYGAKEEALCPDFILEKKGGARMIWAPYKEKDLVHFNMLQKNFSCTEDKLDAINY